MEKDTWQDFNLNNPKDVIEKAVKEQEGSIVENTELVQRFKKAPQMVKKAVPQGVDLISTGYVPRPLQQELHKAFNRFNVIVAHRRFGKTVLAINELIDQALRNPLHNPQYAYIACTYGQAKKIAWNYIKEFTGMIPGVEMREGDLAVIIHRQEIRDEQGNLVKRADKITIWLLSAENPDSLRGLYLDGALLDEYGDMNPIIWTQVIRPALSDRFTLGLEVAGCPTQGWAIFIGTPKGQNHFYERYQYAKENPKNWYAAIFRADKTGIIPDSELEDAQNEMTDDEFAQEFLCDFNAAMTGAFFSKFMIQAEEDGRIGDYPYDPSHAVATFWDLGIADSMAIWFVQKIGAKYRVIDYLEDHGQGMPHYIKQLQLRPYVYSRHYMPHDANQRELSTGTTRMDTFQGMGLYPIDVVPKVHKKADAIHAVRQILPLCEFNAPAVGRGLDALRNYQREWDAKNRIFKKDPKHDWTSHGSDAFQTFARGVDDVLSFIMVGEMYSMMDSQAETSFNPYDY